MLDVPRHAGEGTAESRNGKGKRIRTRLWFQGRIIYVSGVLNYISQYPLSSLLSVFLAWGQNIAKPT